MRREEGQDEKREEGREGYRMRRDGRGGEKRETG